MNKEALQHLDEYDRQIVDRLNVSETTGQTSSLLQTGCLMGISVLAAAGKIIWSTRRAVNNVIIIKPDGV